MDKVYFGDLDYEIETCSYLYEGRPFTGIAYEYYENDVLIYETTFIDGHKQGITRRWYPSGMLKMEHHFKDDAAHGKYKSWYENGVLKEESWKEYGIRVSGKKWSETGELIENFQIDESDSRYKILIGMRERFG